MSAYPSGHLVPSSYLGLVYDQIVETSLPNLSYLISTFNFHTFTSRYFLDFAYHFFTFLEQDPVQEIKKLANFLEVQCTDEFLSEVADNCSFNNMKKSQEEMSNETGDIQTTTGEIANDKGAHEKLISSDSLYRKGTLYNFIDGLPLQTIWYILLIQYDLKLCVFLAEV